MNDAQLETLREWINGPQATHFRTAVKMGTDDSEICIGGWPGPIKFRLLKSLIKKAEPLQRPRKNLFTRSKSS